jgi:hypothetical protein
MYLFMALHAAGVPQAFMNLLRSMSVDVLVFVVADGRITLAYDMGERVLQGVSPERRIVCDCNECVP